jgi:outer membrane protein with beta-barrel domain
LYRRENYFTHKTKIMKKLFIAISLLSMFFGTRVMAQDGTDPREDLTFGLKVGANYSNVYDAQGQNFVADSKVGFAGGVFLGIPLGKYLGFQPEALISQKGFQGSGILEDEPYSFTRTTTYLDIPLLLQLKLTPCLTILAGPQYSYLLSEKDVYTYGANSAAQEQDFSNDNIRKNIFGFVVGADVSISHFLISGRAGWDLQTNNGNGTSSTPQYRNQWLQLTVGFKV